jgi:hypothetical protein
MPREPPVTKTTLFEKSMVPPNLAFAAHKAATPLCYRVAYSHDNCKLK